MYSWSIPQNRDSVSILWEVGNLSGGLSKTLFTYIHCLNEQRVPLKAKQLTYVYVTECCC